MQVVTPAPEPVQNVDTTYTVEDVHAAPPVVAAVNTTYTAPAQENEDVEAESDEVKIVKLSFSSILFCCVFCLSLFR